MAIAKTDRRRYVSYVSYVSFLKPTRGKCQMYFFKWGLKKLIKLTKLIGTQRP